MTLSNRTYLKLLKHSLFSDKFLMRMKNYVEKQNVAKTLFSLLLFDVKH